MSQPKNTRSTIIPALRYRDAAAAIDWLCHAFGFTRLLVVPAEDGAIAHAQLGFGNGMVMLGSLRDDELGRRLQPPQDGVVTQSSYIVVEDADEHYQQARAAGAEIVIEIQDEDYGGRGYTCLDLEGHVWNFGTYDPWAEVASQP